MANWQWKEAREGGRVISSRIHSPRPSREKVELAGAIEDIANRSGGSSRTWHI